MSIKVNDINRDFRSLASTCKSSERNFFGRLPLPETCFHRKPEVEESILDVCACQTQREKRQQCVRTEEIHSVSFIEENVLLAPSRRLEEGAPGRQLKKFLREILLLLSPPPPPLPWFNRLIRSASMRHFYVIAREDFEELPWESRFQVNAVEKMAGNGD